MSDDDMGRRKREQQGTCDCDWVGLVVVVVDYLTVSHVTRTTTTTTLLHCRHGSVGLLP